MQKIAKNLPYARHLTTLSGYIFSTKTYIDNRKKNLLNSSISCRRPHSMANLGLVTAEIGSVVWGTPANFNRFSILSALLHGTLVVDDSQIVMLNRVAAYIQHGGHHVGHWPTLAHILVVLFSLPILSRRILDVCHTSTHDVALVRI